jgi:hypothetical protein
MRRRLSTLAAAASLLLCLATAGMWVRSYWYGDEAQWYWSGDGIGVGSDSGCASLSLTLRNPFPSPGWRSYRIEGSSSRRDHVYGFRHYRLLATTRKLPDAYLLLPANRKILDADIYAFNFPHWCPLLIGIAFVNWWLWRFRIARGCSNRGRCQTCGYDLRATPDRCPECGTAVLPLTAVK